MDKVVSDIMAWIGHHGMNLSAEFKDRKKDGL